MLVGVRNYRCLGDVSAELGGGLAVLLGPNGSGKTSLLEALFLGASGGSALLGWPALAWAVAGRGEPYSPALVNARADAAYIEVDGRGVVVANRPCAEGLDRELDKVVLGGFPKLPAGFREVGRVYSCGVDTVAAVAVYLNSLVPAFRGDGGADALYITPHLAKSLRYTAPLVGKAAETECAAGVLDRLGLRGARNIDGVPHLLPKGGGAVRISDVASGVAYAAVVGLALCAARHVFIDVPEAGMHPGLIETVASVIGDAVKERGVEVAVATQSVEVVDALAHLELDGTVIRLKDCAVHDEMSLQEARERLDALYDDLRYY